MGEDTERAAILTAEQVLGWPFGSTRPDEAKGIQIAGPAGFGSLHIGELPALGLSKNARFRPENRQTCEQNLPGH